MNPIGEELIMTMMERLCGVRCAQDSSSTFEEIKSALAVVLGAEAADVVIREWTARIEELAPVIS
ncbi:MAG: hypothetical protein ABI361_00925 [Nitrososphaera sp.]